MTDDKEQLDGKRSNGKRVALGAALFLFLVGLVLFVWFAAYLVGKGPVPAGRKVVVNIPSGTSVREISSILGEKGLIRDDIRFPLLVKLSGHTAHIRAGEFQLVTGRTPGKLLEELLKARQVQHPVTIREGLRAKEIGEIFAVRGWCDAKSFMTHVTDGRLIESLGLKGIDSLEGYLYPDTYMLTLEMKGAEKIITMMVRRFRYVWQELTGLENTRIPFSRREVVILASIIEMETGDPGERPLIAGLFLNRLKRGMRLQSDPTVIYPYRNIGYSGPITRTHLRTSSPYNTYIISGLPAGPICNPGRESLLAVLRPVENNYLYFVSKNDGTHSFSRTLREHNRAVRKYQRKKRTKKGK
ncbi:endolytic transglycosylase MltG [Desulfomarina sp.]